jgi:hypothetical protein
VAAARRAPQAAPVAAAPVAEAPVAAAPVAAAPGPGRERPERASALRIVGWQVGGALGLAAYDRPWPLAVTFGVAGAALLVAGATRRHGVWLSTRASRRIRRWGRRPATVDDIGALVRRLAPGATLTSTDVGGTPAGAISRPDGLVVVLQTDAAQIPVEAPLTWRELLRPGQPRLIVLKARREVDAADDEALAVVLGNAIRRLRRTKCPVKLLGERELTATLLTMLGVRSFPVRIVERRDHWRIGSKVHIGHRMSSAPPGEATVLRAPGHPDVGLSSVDGAPGAARPGPRRERLDDRHGPAVIATLPIGGPLP